MDGYVRRERGPLELLDDEPVGECSDAEVDEEELNSFLMGDVLTGPEPRQRRKLSFADKLLRKLMRRGKAPGKRTAFRNIAAGRKKRRRRTAAHASKLTPQLEKLMQEAMEMYLDGNFDEAVKILKEVVRRAPGLHDPFHMLGLIYQEEYGDLVTATGYYLLAAHLVQTDLELWRRIGEMSQEMGNIDQAIYCFKKCLKTNEGEPNEEANFALAMCHLEKNDHHGAIKRLHLLFELHPEDVLLLNELTRSLVAVGDRETLLSVLLTHHRKTGDIEAAKRACQLQIAMKLYAECMEFVLAAAAAAATELLDMPSDMLVAYAIAGVHTDAEVTAELEAIWRAEDITPAMMYALAAALAQRCQHTALRWFKRGQAADQPPGGAMVAEQAIHMARCIVAVDKDSESAILLLQEVLQREPTNSEVIILLADFLVQAGRHSEADQLLARLTTTDLDRLRMIQKPIDADERRNELIDLEATVGDVLRTTCAEPRYRPAPCLLAPTRDRLSCPDYRRVSERANRWINRFLRVVHDCELDTERTFQKLSNARTQRTGGEEYLSVMATAGEYADARKDHREPGKSHSFLRTKKGLGLQSAEDILGWDKYEQLLVSAAALIAVVGRAREGVQLLEVIANNKKRYKSNTDGAERRQLLATVEELSCELSCFGGIFKVALVHVRGELAKRGTLRRYGALISTGNLAKAAFVPLSASAEKDTLLENRSWITRQLLQRPHNFDLLMLAGHFCTMSGNWTYAIEEYKRALLQRPRDPVAALCLAVSYFNALSSKVVEDGKKTVLLGMTFLQYSIGLRQTLTEGHPCARVFAAECDYNMARWVCHLWSRMPPGESGVELAECSRRAMHFLNLLHLAVPLYERCLATIKALEDGPPQEENDAPVQCPCVICAIGRRNAQMIPSAPSGLSAGRFVWEYGRKHVMRVRQAISRITQTQAAAFNLFLIYTANRNSVQAAHVAAHHLRWN